MNYDEKKKDWYIPLGKINLHITNLNSILGNLESVYFEKDGDETTEIRLSLDEYNPPKRTKDSQSIELFLRRALVNNLNKKEFKALEFFGDLNERYIGKSATNTFYSSFRSLAQIIITPIE